jgi:AcrR family transcriptional regulator
MQKTEASPDVPGKSITDVATSYGSDRRREIAAVALKLFVERGYAGTSMADVAEQIGTTKGALYHHFATKKDLFVVALAMDSSDPLRAMEQLAAQSGAASERWEKALGHAHDAVFVGAMGRMLPVIAQTGNEIASVAKDYHDMVIARFRRSLQAIYADAIADGTHRYLAPDDIEQIVFGPLLANALTARLVANLPELLEENDARSNRVRFIAMINRLTMV